MGVMDEVTAGGHGRRRLDPGLYPGMVSGGTAIDEAVRLSG
jgi:hypothetical protein